MSTWRFSDTIFWWCISLALFNFETFKPLKKWLLRKFIVFLSMCLSIFPFRSICVTYSIFRKLLLLWNFDNTLKRCTQNMHILIYYSASLITAKRPRFLCVLRLGANIEIIHQNTRDGIFNLLLFHIRRWVHHLV